MVPNFQFRFCAEYIPFLLPDLFSALFHSAPKADQYGHIDRTPASSGFWFGWTMGSTSRNRRKQECDAINFTSSRPVTSEIICVPNGSLFLSTPSSPQGYYTELPSTFQPSPLPGSGSPSLPFPSPCDLPYGSTAPHPHLCKLAF